MFEVSAEEIRMLKARLREINQFPLNQIKWLDDEGQPFKTNPKDLQNWSYTGLTNIDFLEMVVDRRNDSEDQKVKTIKF